MKQYAVTALGNDQPGIVAAMGEALLECDSNIDDSAMTILGGHFAMLLVVESSCEVANIREVLDPVAEHYGLQYDVQPAQRHAFSDQDRDDYVVAAYGPDKPGLVSTLSRVLADAGANITDFGSRLGADNTFAMWFNVSLADGTDLSALEAALNDGGRELGLDVRLHRAEAESL
jgi:glycine cleavage system transcriptional repressor